MAVGNSAGPYSKFAVVCEGVSSSNNGNGTYSLKYKIYVKVTAGSSGFSGTNITIKNNTTGESWSASLYKSDTGHKEFTTNVNYGSTYSVSASAWYRGGSGTTYQSNVNYSWTAPTPTYAVTYNANGGSGVPSNQTKTYNQNLVLSSTVPTRTGYIFLGWGTSASATEVTYAPGATYTANAAVTLYAIWQIAELIDMNVDYVIESIDCEPDGTALILDCSIPFTPISTNNNYTMDFYYRVCYVDDSAGNVADPVANSENTIYGPMTPKDIADGGGDSYAFEIPISANKLRNSLINGKNESAIKFLLQISSINDSFDPDLTISKFIYIYLNDFTFLTLDIIECYRDPSNNNNLYAKVNVDFPDSYIFGVNNTCKFPSIFLDNSETALTPTGTRFKNAGSLITYTLTLDNITSSSHKVKFSISDGISTATGITRVGAVGGENIYLCSNNTIEAVEFVEGDTSGFVKGGRVLAKELVETTEGLYIGDQFICSEIIEL